MTSNLGKQQVIRQRAALVGTSLGSFVAALDVSVVNVATKTIRDAYFGSSLMEVEWVVNGYVLAYGALLVASGRLSDRIGASRVLQIGFGLFASMSLACALSPALEFLLISRFLQGASAALIVPSAISLVRQAYQDPDDRARAIGVWAATGGTLALAVGPVAGGVLTSALGWRSIFLVNVPIATLGLFLIRFSGIPSQAQSSRRSNLDLRATLVFLLATTVGAGLVAMQVSRKILPITLLDIVAAFAFFFIWRTVASTAPSIRLSADFLRRDFFYSTSIAAFANFVLYGLIFVLCLHYQEIWALGPAAVGILLLPLAIAVSLGNILSASIIRVLSPRWSIVLGSCIAMLGEFDIYSNTLPPPPLMLSAVSSLVGFGMGLIVPTATGVMLNGVDAARAGISSGIFSMIRQVGTILGVAITTSLADGGTTPDGLRTCMSAATVATLIITLFSLLGLRPVSTDSDR